MAQLQRLGDFGIVRTLLHLQYEGSMRTSVTWTSIAGRVRLLLFLLFSVYICVALASATEPLRRQVRRGENEPPPQGRLVLLVRAGAPKQFEAGGDEPAPAKVPAGVPFRAPIKESGEWSSGVGVLDIKTLRWSKFYDDRPTWVRASPDAKLVASAYMNGKGMWILNANVHPNPRHIYRGSGPQFSSGPLFWSRDARQLLIAEFIDAPTGPSYRTILFDLETQKAVTVPIPATVQIVDWSPDGRRVLVNCLSPEDPETGWYPSPIDILNTDGTGRRRILDDSKPNVARYSECQFSRDGKRVFYIRFDVTRGSRSLWSIAIDGSEAECIFSGRQNEQVDLFRQSPDGRYFAVRLVSPPPPNSPAVPRFRLAILDGRGTVRMEPPIVNNGFSIIDWCADEQKKPDNHP
jgi:dipeptidyl aminopeptidase/acylaminoacyl peptidase